MSQLHSQSERQTDAQPSSSSRVIRSLKDLYHGFHTDLSSFSFDELQVLHRLNESLIKAEAYRDLQRVVHGPVNLTGQRPLDLSNGQIQSNISQTDYWKKRDDEITRALCDDQTDIEARWKILQEKWEQAKQRRNLQNNADRVQLSLQLPMAPQPSTMRRDEREQRYVLIPPTNIQPRPQGHIDTLQKGKGREAQDPTTQSNLGRQAQVQAAEVTAERILRRIGVFPLPTTLVPNLNDNSNHNDFSTIDEEILSAFNKPYQDPLENFPSFADLQADARAHYDTVITPMITQYKNNQQQNTMQQQSQPINRAFVLPVGGEPPPKNSTKPASSKPKKTTLVTPPTKVKKGTTPKATLTIPRSLSRTQIKHLTHRLRPKNLPARVKFTDQTDIQKIPIKKLMPASSRYGVDGLDGSVCFEVGSRGRGSTGRGSRDGKVSQSSQSKVSGAEGVATMMTPFRLVVRDRNGDVVLDRKWWSSVANGTRQDVESGRTGDVKSVREEG